MILPLGDSITDGYAVHPGGYRLDLFHRALQANKKITFIGSTDNGPDGPQTVDGVPFPGDHEGHSGIQIQQLMDVVPSPAVETKPHIVLLHIGTNDIDEKVDLPNAPKRLGALIDDIFAAYPQALLVVAKIIPIAPPFPQDLVPAFNAAIPAVVEQRTKAGKRILIVDMYTGFPVNTLPDGYHPDEAGGRYMAGVWWAAISNLLP